MPNKPKTPARTFRLAGETLADLERIAAHLTALTGREHNRTDAVRFAAARVAAEVDAGGKKKTGKSA